MNGDRGMCITSQLEALLTTSQILEEVASTTAREAIEMTDEEATESDIETGEMIATVANDEDPDLPITEHRGATTKATHIPLAEITEQESEKTGTADEVELIETSASGTEIADHAEETMETGRLDATAIYLTTEEAVDATEVNEVDEMAAAKIETSLLHKPEAARKSASPPPKKREPTPDLTDVVPVNERKRRLTQWDLKPLGYENVTAEQAKLSGMFPLPGAPRQQPMDASRLKAFMDQPANQVSNAALRPSNARQSKRLFVSNLPQTATEESTTQFFNLQLNGLNVVKAVDPCITASISKDRGFALLEFKAPADATVALAFDGITMDEHVAEANGSANGPITGLEIRRPKDYIVPSADEDAYQEGVVSSDVPDTANKICVSNLPVFLSNDQVTELLGTFGELKAFVLVVDNGTGESRGIAFCEYVDPASTTLAVEGLNGMEIGEQKLKVSRASIGFTQASGLEMGVNAMSMFAGTTSNDFEEGRVLQLLNMVTPEELLDIEDYTEIFDDIEEECQKYGTILEMKIPRPSGGSRENAGVGKIYIKYDTPESAKKALQALAGRKFADRTVVTTYFDEASFEVNGW